ncbi:MAG: sodium:proton antiporter [Planctomycetes bacterium]|nr:sodium:proton antiporter [Planctomycetota bacterium]
MVPAPICLAALLPDAAPPAWTVIPFALLLLSIALLPLLAPKWWHHRSSQALVSAGFGVPAIAIVIWLDPAALGHATLEYLAFVALLGSLFTISGGIRLAGRLAGTPGANTALLAFGAVLANLVGTTGAAMLLIRPFLRANESRRQRTHLVVFFILVVANCGGCLTPLGDPPLFLGFLRGVPFEWTLRLWPQWLTICSGLLVLFRIVDGAIQRREQAADSKDAKVAAGAGGTGHPVEPLRLEGRGNLVLLAAVAVVVLLSGAVVNPRFGETAALLSQAFVLLGLAGLSLRLTPAGLRTANGFSWGPLAEVAILFAAIFVAMVPALALLRVKGAEAGIALPWQLFWGTGALSAFLDNAPTYLAFVAAAQHLPDEVVGTSHAALEAIACGAVFFGAMTYIGNGPNFMVKAIAEETGVRMPSFFGYLGWSVMLLGPLLLLTTFLFFA